MNFVRRSIVAVAFASAASAGTRMARAHGQGELGGSPPNLVVIDERLVTSGQPPAEWLATLREQGFEAVVSLAPPDVQDAVRDEPLIVGRQGLAFVSIPVAFENPQERDFALFSGAMRALSGRKVLVHCQVNLRASSFVFLHRVIALRENPDRAYDAVSRVWKPNATWKRFIEAQLKRHGVAFEPY